MIQNQEEKINNMLRTLSKAAETKKGLDWLMKNVSLVIKDGRKHKARTIYNQAIKFCLKNNYYYLASELAGIIVDVTDKREFDEMSRRIERRPISFPDFKHYGNRCDPESSYERNDWGYGDSEHW